jgi:EmrB/QacA subfamily drug resistance transporter
MALTGSLITRHQSRAEGDRPFRPGLALAVIGTAQVMVTLDTTIVTVALPHIQRGLGFSSSGLEWVVIVYALVFGGLLLLGGRIGDVFGRRRVLVGGLGLFCLASLLGGLAQSQAWLLAARAAQGVGAAVIAPAVLALIITNFPEGPQRNRATGVYAALGAIGGGAGLIIGGLLTTYASWRWCLFVNVPIGVAVALAAPLVLNESPGQRGRFDIAGAVTATAGIGALVYGVSIAAPAGPFDRSHWGSAEVIGALVAAVALLTAFWTIERSVSRPLLPLGLFADRNRNAGYITAAVIGGAFFGVLFYMTLFFQDVWGYSAVRSGLGFVPWLAAFAAASTAGVQLLPRLGPRPLLVTGSVISTGGLYWMAQGSVHSAYWVHAFGPIVLAAAGFGLAVVALVILATSGVRAEQSGVASSLLNVGQQAGGAFCIAVLGTVAWTVAAHRIPAGAQGPQSVPAIVLRHALASGFNRAFLVTVGLALLIGVVALALVRVRVAPSSTGGAQPAEATTKPSVEEPCLRTVPCGSPVVSRVSELSEST